jgi:hypothetical protein
MISLRLFDGQGFAHAQRDNDVKTAQVAKGSGVTRKRILRKMENAMKRFGILMTTAALGAALVASGPAAAFRGAGWHGGGWRSAGWHGGWNRGYGWNNGWGGLGLGLAGLGYGYS